MDLINLGQRELDAAKEVRRRVELGQTTPGDGRSLLGLGLPEFPLVMASGLPCLFEPFGSDTPLDVKDALSELVKRLEGIQYTKATPREDSPFGTNYVSHMTLVSQLTFSFLRPLRSSKVMVYPLCSGAFIDEEVLPIIIHPDHLKDVCASVGADNALNELLTSNKDVIRVEKSSSTSACNLAIMRQCESMATGTNGSHGLQVKMMITYIVSTHHSPCSLLFYRNVQVVAPPLVGSQTSDANTSLAFTTSNVAPCDFGRPHAGADGEAQHGQVDIVDTDYGTICEKKDEHSTRIDGADKPSMDDEYDYRDVRAGQLAVLQLEGGTAGRGWDLFYVTKVLNGSKEITATIELHETQGENYASL